MPKIPKPPAGYDYMGRKMPKKKMPPLGGRDTRPTEMMPRKTRKMGLRPMPARGKGPAIMPKNGPRKAQPRKAQPRRGY